MTVTRKSLDQASEPHRPNVGLEFPLDNPPLGTNKKTNSETNVLDLKYYKDLHEDLDRGILNEPTKVFEEKIQSLLDAARNIGFDDDLISFVEKCITEKFFRAGRNSR